MSKKKIEKPKVFISYAWGSKDYQEKVLAFATQLMGDGIDVIMDKWDLSEGNDTFAFMEKCVMDNSITNVLMLIDPIYAQKADSHKGGVGTETQIISPKVYEEVTQDKFIPIVFERNEKGEVCKPTYLQGRLHFDLTLEEKYDEEYTRLVKTLYGEETYRKPELGNKPDWVEKSYAVEVKKRNTFENLKTITPEKARVTLFSNYVSDILCKIKLIAEAQGGIDDFDEVLAFYQKFDEVKESYLAVLEYSIYVNGAEKCLAKNLEQVAIDIYKITSAAGGLASNFLHELFLYTIAYFLKIEDYAAVGRILSRPYNNLSAYRDKISGYDIFYSGRHDSLDRAMKKRDGKNYICGTATYWIEKIDSHYTKEQFILADLICFNYYVYGKDTLLEWYWFPMTYIYDNEYASVIGGFARKLISKEYVEELLPLFGYDTVTDFVEKIGQVNEDIKQRKYSEIRYAEAWHSPGLISSFIEKDKIASVR